MDLILWRHAEAHPAREGHGDLARALTPRGERQARQMAEWLRARLPASTRILVSPALRTQQTAQALGRPYETVQAVRPDVPPGSVLRAAGWPDAVAPVLVVGHQPTLGMVAAQVLAGEAQRWAVRKAAVWWLRARDPEEGPGVLLHAVMSVETL